MNDSTPEASAEARTLAEPITIRRLGNGWNLREGNAAIPEILTPEELVEQVAIRVGARPEAAGLAYLRGYRAAIAAMRKRVDDVLKDIEPEAAQQDTRSPQTPTLEAIEKWLRRFNQEVEDCPLADMPALIRAAAKDFAALSARPDAGTLEAQLREDAEAIRNGTLVGPLTCALVLERAADALAASRTDDEYMRGYREGKSDTIEAFRFRARTEAPAQPELPSGHHGFLPGLADGEYKCVEGRLYRVEAPAAEARRFASGKEIATCGVDCGCGDECELDTEAPTAEPDMRAFTNLTRSFVPPAAGTPLAEAQDRIDLKIAAIIDQAQKARLIEFVREVALEPYNDSDPASLLNTLRNRARALASEAESREPEATLREIKRMAGVVLDLWDGNEIAPHPSADHQELADTFESLRAWIGQPPREPRPPLEREPETRREWKAKNYAKDLATYLWQNHFQKVAPEWQPAHDLMEILSQIDNMIGSMVRAPEPQAGEPQLEEQRVCPTCKSKGFPQSILGTDHCEFCDGTVGGNPPKKPKSYMEKEGFGYE